MPPRKKTRGTLKRSSSDGPAPDDDPVNPKRPRPDAPSDTSSHITLDTLAAAHRARKPITYKSKARQKAGLSAATPPKLTSFGFNVEHKPKVGRALFHLSPSPRAKAKAKAKIKVFGGPKANKRRASKSGGTTSAETSRIEVESDEYEDEDVDVGGPEPNNSFGTSTERDEVDDQPAPLPTLPAIRPIEGPGLEIRTPLKGRIIPPSLQSLSKRNPRTDATPVPLFAATPRLPVFPLADDANPPASPTKSYNIPVFAPINAVPSTPAHRPRSTSMFTPIVHRNLDEGQDSPAKKPLPVFAPTPARRQQSEPPAPNPFATLTTPAHSHTLPTGPPKLPSMSAALPATDIPATPTAKGRSLPIFTPKQLFPPQEAETEPTEKEEKVIRGVRGTKVSKAPVFGVVEEGEGEEPTPRAGRTAEQPETRTAPDEQQGEGDVSMADIFNASVGQFSPQTERVLTGGQGFLASMAQLDQPPLLTNAPATTTEANAGPSTTRVTRSRSRSASASGSVAPGSGVKTRAGSVTRSRAGSQVPQTKAGSVAPSSRSESVVPDSQPASPSRAGSVLPTPIAENAPIASGSASTTPRSLSIALVPLVTDGGSLVALKALSRRNSMDHRTSQTALMMMDTPGDETPSAFPELEQPTAADVESADDMDAETSPLSSLPEDMSFSFLGVGGKGDTTMGETVGSTTVGDATMREAEETITYDDEMPDRSMEMRDPPNQLAQSPPFSPPAPTSPVSSVPGDPFMHAFSSPRKRPLPSSSPTRPEDVMVPLSDIVRSVLPPPGTRSRSSSLTSLSSLTDLSDEEKPMEVEKDEKGKAPATETRKSMIPVAKRPGTPGPRPPTPGASSKTPFRSVSASGIPKANGVTPGPGRNGAPLTKNGVVSVKNKVAPTPGTSRIGAATPAASSSKVLQPAFTPGSSATLGMGKPPGGRSTGATRTRSGAVKARSLAAPTASTAAKTRTKVVTAPPPPRGRITSFMKPNTARQGPSTSTMPPPPAPTASTSTSPRKGQSKDDSDIRGPRRSMISQDTQASLSSLSSALEKLARPPFGSARGGALPPRPGTSMGFAPPQRPGSSLGFSENSRTAGGNDNSLSSSVGPGGSKPMIKSASVANPAPAPAPAPSGKGKGKAKEGEDDAAYEEPGKAKPKDDPNAPLRSCVIFVDVRTAEGEDAGSLFVDMLKGLGAKIVSRPTPSTTHIVFKSGHQSTLTKYKLYDDPKPFLVGIGWVVQCVEKRARVDEESFAVKTDQVSALDLKKRRKSQLPHQMQFMARDPNPNGPKFGSMSAEAAAVSKSLEASAAQVAQDAELAAERAKQRTQQKLFPRVRDRSPS